MILTVCSKKNEELAINESGRQSRPEVKTITNNILNHTYTLILRQTRSQ